MSFDPSAPIYTLQLLRVTPALWSATQVSSFAPGAVGTEHVQS